MKFLFISEDLIGGNVAAKLQDEGHEVKLYIKEEGRRNNLTNIITKTTDWRSELDWVGKDGTIIFDYVGDGKMHDELRDEGYAVFGGGEKGEALEENREATDKLFRSCNFQTVPVIDFDSIEKAILYVQDNPNRYVIKKNNTSANSVSYVGTESDGSDVVSVLNNYREYNTINTKSISLQTWIDGIEIAVARFFNGKEWISPVELNIEHNPLMPGDIGLSTSEMGTIGWYLEDENNILYQNTLKKIESHLRDIDYRGAVDINCIVNKDGIFPLEVTARLGSPICHLQSEMIKTGWGNLLYSCAHGTEHKAQFNSGYGIVVFVTAPPFPYTKKLETINPKGQLIHFIKDTPAAGFIHLEDVSLDLINRQYYISDTRGYILYVTASEQTMIEAQETVYKRISNIHFPKMMYRNDIGTNFIQEGELELKKWGYL